MALPLLSARGCITLASAVAHAREALGPDGHEFDRLAMESSLADPEVKDYMAALNALALLPEPRHSKGDTT